MHIDRLAQLEHACCHISQKDLLNMQIMLGSIIIRMYASALLRFHGRSYRSTSHAISSHLSHDVQLPRLLSLSYF